MQAVLFDLDGTLLDTVPDIRAALNEALAHFGLPEIGYAQTVEFIGNGAEKLIERAAPQGPREELLARFAEIYDGSDNGLTRPYEGMRALLEELKGRGMKLAVVSNKLQRATEQVIGKFYGGLFDFIGGDSGMFPVKPDPTLARYAALSMHVPLAECVFVGDGETDVETARRAGMREIAVLWGYRTRERLMQAGATVFAGDIAQLRTLLLG